MRLVSAASIAFLTMCLAACGANRPYSTAASTQSTTPRVAETQRQPAPVMPAVSVPCDLANLDAFTAQTTNALCSIAYGGETCRRLAKSSVEGRGLSVGDSANTCGFPSSNECALLLGRLAVSANPVPTACNVRNDKASLTALNCRAAVGGFLLNLRRSSGLVGTCGQPLTSKELDLYKN